MSPSLAGLCRILHRAANFTRNLVESSLGGEVYAPREMVGHTSLLRHLYASSEGSDPGMAGVADCESPFTQLETEEMGAENYSVRHLRGIQQA